MVFQLTADRQAQYVTREIFIITCTNAHSVLIVLSWFGDVVHFLFQAHLLSRNQDEPMNVSIIASWISPYNILRCMPSKIQCTG